MRSMIATASALLLLAACDPDLIRHDGGTLGPPPDGGPGDAQAHVDAAMLDGGEIDAGLADAKAGDAGANPCTLSFETQVEFERTEVGRNRNRALLLMNTGPFDCAVEVSVSPTGAFQLTGPVTAQLRPGESVQVDLQFSPNAPGYFTAHLAVLFAGDSTPSLLTALRGEGFLAEVASTRQIIYQVTNQTTEDRYLVLEGRDCLGLDPSVPLALSFQCGCECPPPPAAGPVRLLRVPPGATRSLTWDTRELHTWRVPIECGPDFTVEDVRGALAPVPDGTYPTRIAFERSLPSFCGPAGGSDPDVFECDPTSDVPEAPPVISVLCDTAGAVSVLAPVTHLDAAVQVDLTD